MKKNFKILNSDAILKQQKKGIKIDETEVLINCSYNAKFYRKRSEITIYFLIIFEII